MVWRDINNWYKALNEAAYIIKQIDNSRPVTTAHGEIPNKILIEKLDNIDAWGINVYRWMIQVICLKNGQILVKNHYTFLKLEVIVTWQLKNMVI